MTRGQTRGLTPGHGWSGQACTGILLVGGASERFGSPKALASFRGESLGERAWRTLSAVCDEVIAVGKSADAIELPFPVVDDGTAERAAVFGVIAGLRAATHETCLVLPVDTPLVTPELLQQLLTETAVPQTGPLPGAYSKRMLAELESRVAGGELSLKGVNTTVAELDERLLANVNTRVELMTAAVAEWAAERPDIRALLLVGSHARSSAPADRWSDLDLIFFIEEPRMYHEDSTWFRQFGVPLVSFLEPKPDGHSDRRVIYETGEEVDFVLFPASAIERLGAGASESVAGLLARGYRLLIDRVGIADRLEASAAQWRVLDPSQLAFDGLASDFWYHALWTAKKLRRGEVFTALECLDGHMKDRLVTLLAWHARSLDSEVDTWHAGRFLERWADPGALATLERAYAHYDLRDVARALWETIDLFQRLEEETARRLGIAVELDHADLRRSVSEVVRDPRRGATL